MNSATPDFIKAMDGIERIHTARGSHIEPPLDDRWDERTKLSWLLAVVKADTSLEAKLYDSNYRVGGRRPWGGTFWGIQTKGRSGGGGQFNQVWSALHNMGAGYKAGLESAHDEVQS